MESSKSIITGNKRRHFHTFDALRFFSFLLVFFHHIPIDTSSFFLYFGRSGGLGVSVFFVLSGFLITYILIFEKENNRTISLKNFFMRRILRIWPLFYAMILFAFLTPFILKLLNLSYSDVGYEPNWTLSLLFLENYNMMFSHNFPNVSPLRVMWSLCVEEHFYITWGLIMFFIATKRIPTLLIITIFLAPVIRMFYFNIDIDTADLFSNIDYFAFGAVAAYLLVYNKKVMDFIEIIDVKYKWSFFFITTGILFLIPNIESYWVNIFTPTIVGLLVSVVILFTLTHKNSLEIKDTNLLSVLGKYTYGLYLFHTIIINLIIQINKKTVFEINWVLLAIISLVLSVVTSYLSYHLFEKQFLKMKKFFYR